MQAHRRACTSTLTSCMRAAAVDMPRPPRELPMHARAHAHALAPTPAPSEAHMRTREHITQCISFDMSNPCSMIRMRTKVIEPHRHLHVRAREGVGGDHSTATPGNGTPSCQALRAKPTTQRPAAGPDDTAASGPKAGCDPRPAPSTASWTSLRQQHSYEECTRLAETRLAQNILLFYDVLSFSNN